MGDFLGETDQPSNIRGVEKKRSEERGVLSQCEKEERE